MAKRKEQEEAQVSLAAPPAPKRTNGRRKADRSPEDTTSSKKRKTCLGSKAAPSDSKSIWGQYGLPIKEYTHLQGFAASIAKDTSRIYILPTYILEEIMINLEKARKAAGIGTYRTPDTKEAIKVLLFLNIIPQIVSLFAPAVISVPESAVLGGVANADPLYPRGFADIQIFTLGAVTIILGELKKCVVAADGLAHLLRRMITVRESNRRRGIDCKVVGIINDGDCFLFISLDSHFKCEAEYWLDVDGYGRFRMDIQLVICHIFTVILDSLVCVVKGVASQCSKDDTLEINSIAYFEDHAQGMIGGQLMLPIKPDSVESYERLGNDLTSVRETLSLCPSKNEDEEVRAVAELKHLVISLGRMIPGVHFTSLLEPEAERDLVKLSVDFFRTQREVDWHLFAALQRCKDGSVDSIPRRTKDGYILEVPREGLGTRPKADPGVEQRLQQAFIHNKEQLARIQPVKLDSFGVTRAISLGVFLEFRQALATTFPDKDLTPASPFLSEGCNLTNDVIYQSLTHLRADENLAVRLLGTGMDQAKFNVLKYLSWDHFVLFRWEAEEVLTLRQVVQRRC